MADDDKPVTVDDLMAAPWKFAGHGDGSDKHGRFSINFHTCEYRGRTLRGSRKIWSDGSRQEVAFAVDGQSVGTLAELAVLLNLRYTAGDDARGAVGGDD